MKTYRMHRTIKYFLDVEAENEEEAQDLFDTAPFSWENVLTNDFESIEDITMYKTKKIDNYTFKHGNHLESIINIPEGLRARALKGPVGYFIVLDEFPVEIFPEHSFERHHAEYYGLTLSLEQVTQDEK